MKINALFIWLCKLSCKKYPEAMVAWHDPAPQKDSYEPTVQFYATASGLQTSLLQIKMNTATSFQKLFMVYANQQILDLILSFNSSFTLSHSSSSLFIVAYWLSSRYPAWFSILPIRLRFGAPLVDGAIEVDWIGYQLSMNQTKPKFNKRKTHTLQHNNHPLPLTIHCCCATIEYNGAI